MIYYRIPVIRDIVKLRAGAGVGVWGIMIFSTSVSRAKTRSFPMSMRVSIGSSGAAVIWNSSSVRPGAMPVGVRLFVCPAWRGNGCQPLAYQLFRLLPWYRLSLLTDTIHYSMGICRILPPEGSRLFRPLWERHG